MTTTVKDIYATLKADAWRSEKGFSKELEEVNAKLLQAKISEETISDRLSSWLQKYQPCLFGRIAAKMGLITYCILHEEDLDSDEKIKRKIQHSRLSLTTPTSNI